MAHIRKTSFEQYVIGMVLALLRYNCELGKHHLPVQKINAAAENWSSRDGQLFWRGQPFSGYRYTLYSLRDTAEMIPFWRGKEEGVARSRETEESSRCSNDGATDYPSVPATEHPCLPAGRLKERGNNIQLRNMKSRKYLRDANSYSSEPLKKRNVVVTLSLPKGEVKKVLFVNHASACSA